MKLKYNNINFSVFDAYNEFLTVQLNFKNLKKKGKLKIENYFEYFSLYSIIFFILLIILFSLFI